MSFGDAFVSVGIGAEAVMWNPAGIVFEKRIELIGNYAMMYSIDGLSSYSSSVAYNAKFGAFGLGWNGLALADEYSENLVALEFAKKFRNVSVGLAVKTFIVSASGYDKYNDPNFESSKAIFTGDIGILWNPTGKLKIATVMRNLNSPKISLISTTVEKDKLDRNFVLGASYRIQDFLTFSMDMVTEKGDFSDIIFNAGTEIAFFDAIALRSGFADSRLGMGLGLFTQRWAFDFGLHSHKNLGNLYQFSLKLGF